MRRVGFVTVLFFSWLNSCMNDHLFVFKGFFSVHTSRVSCLISVTPNVVVFARVAWCYTPSLFGSDSNDPTRSFGSSMSVR